jgi:hypothetical protein
VSVTVVAGLIVAAGFFFLAVNIEGMMSRPEIGKSTGGFYYFLYTGITELNHFSRFGIYKVVVLFALIGFFKLGNVFPELMLDNQVAFKQKIDRIVQGCPADPVILVFH